MQESYHFDLTIRPKRLLVTVLILVLVVLALWFGIGYLSGPPVNPLTRDDVMVFRHPVMGTLYNGGLINKETGKPCGLWVLTDAKRKHILWQYTYDACTAPNWMLKGKYNFKRGKVE